MHPSDSPHPDAAAPHRAGVVAILGRPNAGKSTLLNRLLGQKLAIVTAKPQTTRSRILGVLTLPSAQLLLLDTPGLHEATRALNQALNAIAEDVADGCDVALLLLDPRTRWDEAHEALRARLAAKGTPVLVVATKADLGMPPQAEAELAISAESGAGIDGLLARLVALVPESPPHYDPETITDRTVRFLAAEEIREAIFEELSEEVPYSVAVEIDQFDESKPDGARIRATLWVERDSQKGIVLGQGGRKIKAIGQRARHAIERLLDGPAHLSLWVKVDPKWAKKPKKLSALGYV